MARRRGGRGDLDPRRVLRWTSVRGPVAASVSVGLLSTAAVVVQAVAIADLLAGAMPGARPGDRPRLLAWFMGGAALRGACALVGEVVGRVGAARAKADLRAGLVRAAVRGAPGDPITGGPVGGGDVAALAGRGLDALDAYVGRCLPDFVLAVAAPVALTVAVGLLDWVSALVITTTLVLFPVFGALVGRASTTMAADRWQQVEHLGRTVADVFEGLPVLRAFGRSAQQRGRIEQAGEALRRASVATLRVAFLSALVLDTLASLSVALVAVPLGLRLLHGSIHLAAALAVLVVAPEVFVPLRRASAEFHESTEGLAAAGRALAFVAGDAEAPVAPVGDGRRRDPAPLRRAPDPRFVPLSLRAVGTAVRGGDGPVLEDASLTVSPGETVALVGANGCGKTTALLLMLGFLRPVRGRVLVGDAGLEDLDPASWRAQLTYLPERPVLLDASLADNLRLARPDADDDALVAALTAAGGHALLERLPAGLDTPVGIGGRRLSAGERQRIALARTLLRPASLYLLDEPTVHLDDTTEALVTEGLARALRDASAVVVTHRPAVAALADRVVTVRDGHFVAATPDGRPAPAPPDGRPAPAPPERRPAPAPLGGRRRVPA